MAGGSYRRTKGTFAYVDGGSETPEMASKSFAVDLLTAFVTVMSWVAIVALPALVLTLAALLFTPGVITP